MPNKAITVTQPSGGYRGEALATQPVVRVTDIDDNTNTTFTGIVFATPNSGSALLGTTSIAAVAGIATFTNLAFPTSGNANQIIFTPSSLISAISNTLTLLSPPNFYITQPVGTARNTAFSTQPVLTFRVGNVNSAIDTSITANVTASLVRNPPHCSTGESVSLIGTTTVAAVNGVATFTNLGVAGNIGDCFIVAFTSSRFNLSALETSGINLTGAVCDGSSFTCQVGDTGPGGGIIFYYSSVAFSCGLTLSSNCNYLEAAISSSDPQITWSTVGNQGIAVSGADASAIGAGHKNSDEIKLQSGNVAASSAAVYALDFSSGGKDDWYLPSKDEVNQMIAQKVLLDLQASGNAASRTYWSSTEIDASSAWGHPTNGSASTTAKIFAGRVRSIRAF